jgi:GNAT superfamily N-acetyltransferase
MGAEGFSKLADKHGREHDENPLQHFKEKIHSIYLLLKWGLTSRYFCTILCLSICQASIMFLGGWPYQTIPSSLTSMGLYRFYATAARIRKYLSPAAKKYLPEFLAAPLRDRGDGLIGPACLQMLLPDLRALPAIKTPPGYYSAALSPGYEMDYVTVMRQSLAADADMAWFHATFGGEPENNPDNLLLIYDSTAPAAAAAAWQTRLGSKKTGLVYMVGVARAYQGRGLGRIITLLALRRLEERGFHDAMAAIEDFRIPALSLCLSLGFTPLYRNKVDAKRWKRVMQKIRPRSG